MLDRGTTLFEHTQQCPNSTAALLRRGHTPKSWHWSNGKRAATYVDVAIPNRDI